MKTVRIINAKTVGAFLKGLREAAKLTQADVASQMGTTSSAIARLESGGGSKEHSPSIKTITSYLNVVNCDLVISAVAKIPAEKAEVAA